MTAAQNKVLKLYSYMLIFRYILHMQVNSHCSCTNSVHCATPNASSVNNNASGEDGNSQDEECLLFNLEGILNHIQLKLGQSRAECRNRRANSVQWELLTDFQAATDRVVHTLPRIKLLLQSPCIYGLRNLDSHVMSLYTIVPYLSSLNASEPQHLSGNISEVIFPVVSQLLVSAQQLVSIVVA